MSADAILRGPLVAPYALREVDLAEEIGDLVLGPGEGGAHVLVRLRGHPVGRRWISRAVDGDRVPAARLRAIAQRSAEKSLGDAAALIAAAVAPAPLDVTVAVCTRGRPALLARCLAALAAARDASAGAARGDSVELLVVDNAPEDDGTRNVACGRPGVRYAVEPLPGLDFGRNRALAEARGRWIAYVDDDAVVDRPWFDRLAEALTIAPEAAALTGPVLPLALDTEAQLRFERAGGFSKDFRWRRFGPEAWDDVVHPIGAGRFGAGACMAFHAGTLRALGGFDEALDTGPPLPGGGDIDAFFRVLASGRSLAMVPGLAVWHEHRRDMAGLRRQYWTWGLGVAAFYAKTVRTHPGFAGRRRRVYAWHAREFMRQFVRALRGRSARTPGNVLAEAIGMAQGALGEYGRSEARVAAIRRAAAQEGVAASAAPAAPAAGAAR